MWMRLPQAYEDALGVKTVGESPNSLHKAVTLARNPVSALRMTCSRLILLLDLCTPDARAGCSSGPLSPTLSHICTCTPSPNSYAAWSPDSRFLAVGSYDQSCRLISTLTWSVVADFRHVHPRLVRRDEAGGLGQGLGVRVDIGQQQGRGKKVQRWRLLPQRG